MQFHPLHFRVRMPLRIAFVALSGADVATINAEPDAYFRTTSGGALDRDLAARHSRTLLDTSSYI